jgi:penicillin-insensitive murein DD-endopeptidase
VKAPHCLVAALVVLVSGLPALADSPRSVANTKVSVSVGYPNAGSQLRAKRLKKSPWLVILEKSKDRTYGHPSLVLMLQRSAKQVGKAFKGAKLVVGDLSAKDGGPLSGHHSHQSGRDADIAFYARDAKGRAVQPAKFVAFGADGKAKDGSGLVFDDAMNWALVESFAKDHRAGLAYIFVSKPLKARLLAYANRHERHKKYVEKVQALFVQPDNAEPHDDHFHVRIRCPKGQDDVCKELPR